jgi:hypothetical protein
LNQPGCELVGEANDVSQNYRVKVRCEWSDGPPKDQSSCEDLLKEYLLSHRKVVEEDS